MTTSRARTGRTGPVNVWNMAKGLIPFREGHWQGHAAWVCTPASTLPEAFREAQESRTRVYMGTGNRVAVGSAVRYWVAYDAIPVAWVCVDGSTHFAESSWVAWASPVERAQLEENPPAYEPMQEAAVAQHELTARTIPPRWPARFIWADPSDPYLPDTHAADVVAGYLPCARCGSGPGERCREGCVARPASTRQGT